MNYTENPKPDADAVEVKEPVAAYYTIGVGNAIAEPYGANPDGDWDDYDDEDDDEPLTPERKAAIRRDPAFIAWKEGIIRRLWEGVEDVKAGRGRPIDEWWNDFKRKVENGEL